MCSGAAYLDPDKFMLFDADGKEVTVGDYEVYFDVWGRIALLPTSSCSSMPMRGEDRAQGGYYIPPWAAMRWTTSSRRTQS